MSTAKITILLGVGGAKSKNKSKEDDQGRKTMQLNFKV